MVFDYNLTPGRLLQENNFLLEEKAPVISIITAFYNDDKYINQTANSVLNQTYPYFEWIIVNDGSTSLESTKRLKEIEALDSRIKVLHKENTGVSHTRDYGAKFAHTNSQYLLFLDSDDLLQNTYLECSYWTLETHPEAAFAYSDFVNFGEQNFLWRKWFNIEGEIKENLLALTALIRKKAFLEVNRV